MVLTKSGTLRNEARTVIQGQPGIAAGRGLMLGPPNEKLLPGRGAERLGADQGHLPAAAMVEETSGGAEEMAGGAARKAGGVEGRAVAASEIAGVAGVTKSETAGSAGEGTVEIAGTGPVAGASRESRAAHRPPAMTEMRTLR